MIAGVEVHAISGSGEENPAVVRCAVRPALQTGSDINGVCGAQRGGRRGGDQGSIVFIRLNTRIAAKVVIRDSTAGPIHQTFVHICWVTVGGGAGIQICDHVSKAGGGNGRAVRNGTTFGGKQIREAHQRDFIGGGAAVIIPLQICVGVEVGIPLSCAAQERIHCASITSNPLLESQCCDVSQCHHIG